MIFSERDIAALKLLYWCQYIQESDLRKILSDTDIHNLSCSSLIKLHVKSNSIILTSYARDMLASIDRNLPNAALSYHPHICQRRIRSSKFMLTMYRAFPNSFTDSLKELVKNPSLFLPHLTRGKGQNPWGSTRIISIAHLGDLFCAVHYICPGIGKLALTDELAAFSNQTARFPGVKRAFIFAGESYKDILAELEADTQTDTKLISYGGAYRCLHLPVHLLSCDNTGAVQLQIMAQPDYHTRLARAALKKEYRPPPLDVPAWDAFFSGVPFVIAADMDLRRLDAAIQAARNRGLEQIAVAALEKQAKTVLIPRYQNTGQARVFALTGEAISQVTGQPPVPYTPPRTQFLTEKGDVVDAPPIRISGKAGGQAGGKTRPLV